MSKKRTRVHWYKDLCTNCARLYCRHVCYGGEQMKGESESGNTYYISYTRNCDSLQMTRCGYLGCICCELINRPKSGTKCRYYKPKTAGIGDVKEAEHRTEKNSQRRKMKTFEMKTFEEWCNDKEIVPDELSPKLLTRAYKIWGEACFVEGQYLIAENTDLIKHIYVLEHAMRWLKNLCSKLKRTP